MGKLVDIKEFNLTRAAKSGAARWSAHFKGQILTRRTTLEEISGEELIGLGRIDQEAAYRLQDIVMAILELGAHAKFDYLSPRDKLKVIDSYLFLADQVRFECMRRLGWVRGFPGEGRPLVEIVLYPIEIKKEHLSTPPEMLDAHPRYGEWFKRRTMDGEAVIRSIMPEALARFELGLKKGQ